MRLRGIGLLCTLDSFRREFKRPGENERNRKSDHNHQDNEAHRPIRNFEERKDLRRNLDQ